MTDGTRYEGRIENWRERFPEDKVEHYRPGSSGGIYKVYDSQRGVFVGIKELRGTVEGVKLYAEDNIKTERERIRTIEDVFNTVGKTNIPGLMQVYGYYETERRGLKHPQLVFELLPYDSVLDQINANGPRSEEEVRRFLVSNGATLDGLHTANGEPIFHRDVKPANIIAMPKDGRWPFVLVDLGTLGVGTRETFYGTHAGTLRYVPIKQIGAGKMNKEIENFALIRSAIHYAIGKRFDQIDFDNVDIKKLQLNFSPELQRVFASTTTQEESQWYNSFGKLMHDLGYKINRAPQTRQELESILGKSGLPPEIKPQVTAVARGKPNNLENVVKYNTEVSGALALAGALVGAGALALAGALVGAGGVAGGVVVAGAGGVVVAGAGAVAGAVAESMGLSAEKQSYHIKRGAIYSTLGAIANISQALLLETSLEQKMALGATIQGISTLIEPTIIIGKHYLARRRKAAEFGARVSQGLEGKVEDVKLTIEERHKIVNKTLSTGLGIGIASIVAYATGAEINNYYLAIGGGVGLLTSLATTISLNSPFEKYFTNHALKQKRISLGLPPEEPKQTSLIHIQERLPPQLKEGGSGATILGGELGKEFLEVYNARVKERYNANKNLRVLKRGRFGNRVVKGGNSFSGVLASEILEEMGLAMATRQDLERILKNRMLDLTDCYTNFGLALRGGSDSYQPNDFLARDLARKLRNQRIEKLETLIPFNALTLVNNKNSHYGLSFDLKENAGNLIQNLGNFNWHYKREGLSGLYLDDGLDLGSDDYLLADSGDGGRVVVVSGEAARKSSEGIVTSSYIAASGEDF